LGFQTIVQAATDASTQGMASLCVGDCSTIVTEEGGFFGEGSLACWPTSGKISQLPFGGYSHGSQDAFDIGTSGGTSIYAPIGGSIVYEKNNSSGCKATITIKDGEYAGKQLVFGHMPWNVCDNTAGIDVKRGTVQAGELVGYVGTTGQSTGNHLHYELKPPTRPSILMQHLPERMYAVISATCKNI